MVYVVAWCNVILWYFHDSASWFYILLYSLYYSCLPWFCSYPTIVFALFQFHFPWLCCLMYLPADRLGWFCTKSVLLGTLLLWRSLRFLTPLLVCSLEMLAWLTCWWDQIVSAFAGAGASSPAPLLSACLVDWFRSLPAESFRLCSAHEPFMLRLCLIYEVIHLKFPTYLSCWA